MLGPGLGGLFAVGLFVFALFDVISTDDILVRNLPKGMWLVLVIFVPIIGPIAWLIMGRPMYASWQPGGQSAPRPRRRYVAPEDRPDFGSRAAPPTSSGRTADDLRRWEQELARRDDELRRRDEDDTPTT
ncbi:MAG: PLDc_N domain-containing protein [Acidimicrobiia bacterium]|nr:PLDc_N domain-containing protein [Acidimicrobiia bacterium]